MSDKIDIMLNSGENISLPTWALETTQKEVLTAIMAMANATSGSRKIDLEIQKYTEKMFKEIKEGNTTDKDRTKEQEKQHKESIEASKEVADRIKENKQALQDFKSKGPLSIMEKTIDHLESDIETVGKSLGTVAEKVFLAGAVIAGSLATGATFIGNALLGAGHQLNELTASGVGFNNTFAEIGKSATEGVAGLGALGIGFAGAADLIKHSSNVVATAGFGKFQTTMKYAADMSEELGMSFETSMDQFADGMRRRQGVIDLSNVSQGALTKTLTGTIKAQKVYSQALGVSTTDLENFVTALMDRAGGLTASLLRMDNGIRNQVVGGIEVFATGLRGLGGEAGGDIAEAFTDAAAAGAIGLSEGAVGYITALPSLTGPMNEYISAVQGGTLSQEQARNMVSDLTKNLGNLSAGEKDRVFALARIGDESAKSMAKAITQFEQSENKIKDLNKQFGTAFDMDTVQKGTNEFNKVLNQAKGAFSNAFYSLFADPGVIGALNDGLKEIMSVFGFATDDMSGAAMDAGSLVKGLAEKAIPVIKSIMKSLKGFAEYIKDAFDSGGIAGVFKQLLGDAVGGIIKALIKYGIIFAGLMFAGRYALELAKTSIMPQAKAFGLKMFQGGVGAGKQLMQNAGKWMSSLLDMKGVKSLQSSVMKGAGALKDRVMGGKDGKGGVGAKVAEKLGSFQKDGAKMTDKLSGAMTKGGKSGGFLKSIADSVKKFGDNKTLKGAQSLIILGGALLVTAIGLKKFNEVDVTSIIKGGVALYGLNEVAKRIGKGSTAMLKGAAAIAILGASIIPMAIGMKVFNGVGIGTVLNMAAGLTVLGVAGAAIGTFMPLMLSGALGIAALGAAVIPFAIAMKIMDGVGLGTIGVMAAGLTVLGLAAAGLGFALPFILMGSVAIAALGVALIPFGIGLKVVSSVIPQFAEGMEKIAKVDFLNLMLAGPALISLAAGMAVLSGGGLISGLLDGIGSLFGAESPFDKIAKIGDSAKHINKMSEEMRNMGDTVDAFTTALNDIDGSSIGSQFFLIADGLTALNTAISNINLMSIAKLALLGAVMPGSTGSEPTTESKQDPTQLATTESTQDQKQIALARIGDDGKTKTGPSRRGSPRLQKLRALRDQMDMSSGSNSGVFVGGKLQQPGIEVPMNPLSPTNVSTQYGNDDTLDDVLATNTDTTNAPSVTQQAATQLSPQEEANTTTLADVNASLQQLLDAQNQNNKIGKKTQRNIEGLEI